MIFIVIFQDNAGQEHLRQQHMPEHLAFLDSQSGILGAGPLFDAQGDGQGGQWMVDAPDFATVEAMTRTDPFFDTGLRKSITILEWRQVFRDGKRLI